MDRLVNKAITKIAIISVPIMERIGSELVKITAVEAQIIIVLAPSAGATSNIASLNAV